MTPILAFVALSVSLGVSAQSSTGLSSQCTSALAQIATNSTSACLSPSSLIPILTASGNTSIIPSVDSWLNNVCGVAPCSNDTLSAIVTNVTSGCGTELSALGFSSTDTATLISTVQEFYPTVRQVACLEDGNTNCVTETLTNLQDVVGNLTLTSIAGLVASGSNTSIPSNVTCSNCVKAAYNTVNTAFPDLLGSESSTLQDQCGASFTDGSSPSGIVESASNSSTSSGSNSGVAVALISANALLGLGASFLLILGSAFLVV
ncbi:hypothetical protein J3R30DRAFT_1757052 [Lentinula aciculospora]|uniref:Uncharacterized protein n=1 Tax=Lentinula aciculospora TaxID=153920 RepID=A0A9W9AJS0_9AGAR|nr:hypothetical protein J3R30DRAFT_1757052 [Lentinula aciculospora]